jgi:CDGSH-type Zn-finger protein
MITALTNGPFIVKGPCTIVDQGGNAFAGNTSDTVALCRCGFSATKPFCDGSHVKRGFQAPAVGLPREGTESARRAIARIAAEAGLSLVVVDELPGDVLADWTWAGKRSPETNHNLPQA